MCGFIAQLVEHRTGNAEVTVSNPVEAWIFFRLLISNCINWKIHCDDHFSLSVPETVVNHFKVHQYLPSNRNYISFPAFSQQLIGPSGPGSSDMGRK